MRRFVLLPCILFLVILLLPGGYPSSSALFAHGANASKASAALSALSPAPQDAPSDRRYLITIQCERIAYMHLGEEITISHHYGELEINNGDTLTLTGTQVRIDTLITEEDEKYPDIGGGSVFFDMAEGTGTVSQTLQIRVDETGSSRYKSAYAIWEITYILTPVVP